MTIRHHLQSAQCIALTAICIRYLLHLSFLCVHLLSLISLLPFNTFFPPIASLSSFRYLLSVSMFSFLFSIYLSFFLFLPNLFSHSQGNAKLPCITFPPPARIRSTSWTNWQQQSFRKAKNQKRRTWLREFLQPDSRHQMQWRKMYRDPAVVRTDSMARQHLAGSQFERLTQPTVSPVGIWQQSIRISYW